MAPQAPASTAAGQSSSLLSEVQELTPAEAKKRLVAAKADLQGSLTRKRAIDRNLANLEFSLYQYETSYLAPAPEGIPLGNVVKGYDNYLKALTTTSLGPYDRKRTRIGGPDVREDERLFSRSSETYVRSLELKERDMSATSDDDQPANKKRKMR